MTRIRTVKPALFKHEELFDAEQETGLPLRVAFIGLFCCCDREGRFKWHPRTLKSDALSFDDVDFSRVLDALCDVGLVRRYEAEGSIYGSIPTFTVHQAVNMREAKSVLPAPPPTSERVAHVHAHAEPVAGCAEHLSANVLPKTRTRIYERDGHKCLRCGNTENLSIDRIFPRSIGGTHTDANLRTLCRACNSASPTQGQALIDDLARDGYTLDDKRRIRAHVHARGREYGIWKGKEYKNRAWARTRESPPRFIARAYLLSHGVAEKIADDWLTLRRTKRASVTETAIAGIEREAAKASLSLNDALQACCERAWSGFRASWLDRERHSGPGPPHGNGTRNGAGLWALLSMCPLTHLISECRAIHVSNREISP
jgi:hypothetical protein